MFTGFASENTPAVQVWDFARPYASTGANRSLALADDCAPIQFFKTGSVADLDINVYMPTAPVEGKSITIVNAQFANQKQTIAVYAAESFYGTAVILFRIGPGQKVQFVYSKASISSGTANGSFPTSWISLDLAHKGALNQGAAVIAGNNNSAANSNAFAAGGSNNNATSGNAAVVGGGSNTASGSSSAVVGGSNSTASGSGAAVVGGTGNTASGTYAAVIGGNNNAASDFNAVSVGGNGNSASGQGSISLGGLSNFANANQSMVAGGAYGNARSIVGNFVVPASSFPISGFNGRQQLCTLLLGRETTDATATRLASDANAASTINQVILPNNSAYYVKGSIIATVTGGGNTKSWDFIATIKRGANAAATSIVGAVTLNVQAANAGASTWVVAITADTTNGGLAVTVTGQAATTIRWVAKLESTEVTF